MLHAEPMTARELRDRFDWLQRGRSLTREEREIAFAAMLSDLRRVGLVTDEVAYRVRPRGVVLRLAYRARKEAAGLALLVLTLPGALFAWVLEVLADVAEEKRP
jgi:hypothetical protein